MEIAPFVKTRINQDNMNCKSTKFNLNPDLEIPDQVDVKQ